MAVHNGLPYLREAIESVLDQSFVDFEFVVVDDASTDGSAECVASFRDSRIRLLRNVTNLGQTRSLNRGLQETRAPYVARLDADDVCLPSRLERQVQGLHARPDIAVLGTWMYDIDAAGSRTALVSRRWDDVGTYLAWLLLEICPLWHPTVMFRRAAVLEVGGYDESFRIAQDYDLWMRCALRRHWGAVLPEPLVLCRRHAGQQTVVRETAHRREVDVAHERMVAACCPGDDTRRLALLLRCDDAFWRETVSRGEVVATLRAVVRLTHHLASRLGLSAVEAARLRRGLYRRLGQGARFGARLGAWPAVAFYPVLFGLSPLLIPGLRRDLRGLRSRVRFLLSRVT
jgi:glycosyltransferase involved in cell wall biosynthesis